MDSSSGVIFKVISKDTSSTNFVKTLNFPITLIGSVILKNLLFISLPVFSSKASATIVGVIDPYNLPVGPVLTSISSSKSFKLSATTCQSLVSWILLSSASALSFVALCRASSVARTATP